MLVKNVLSYKFGIQLDKSDSGRSQQLTSEGQWGHSLCLMWQNLLHFEIFRIGCGERENTLTKDHSLSYFLETRQIWLRRGRFLTKTRKLLPRSTVSSTSRQVPWVEKMYRNAFRQSFKPSLTSFRRIPPYIPNPFLPEILCFMLRKMRSQNRPVRAATREKKSPIQTFRYPVNTITASEIWSYR